MKKQTKYNAVALTPSTAKLLIELIEARVKSGNPIDNRVKIIQDLISKAHKKECK